MPPPKYPIPVFPFPLESPNSFSLIPKNQDLLIYQLLFPINHWAKPLLPLYNHLQPHITLTSLHISILPSLNHPLVTHTLSLLPRISLLIPVYLSPLLIPLSHHLNTYTILFDINKVSGHDQDWLNSVLCHEIVLKIIQVVDELLLLYFWLELNNGYFAFNNIWYLEKILF